MLKLISVLAFFALPLSASASALGFLRPGTDIRGTFGNAIGGVVKAVDPSSCLGDLMMTGYSNDLYGEDDYRYQPHCYSGGEANRLTCFPGFSLVHTRDGLRPMRDLGIGDEILSSVSADGQPNFEKVLFFLHRDELRMAGDWVEVVHALGSLVLSSTHMVFKTNGHGGLESVAAKRLRGGDELNVVVDGAVVKSTVSSVTPSRNHLGVYAPVTESGTLFVDGVLSSSYSSLDLFGAYEAAWAHALLDSAARPLKFLAARPRLARPLARLLSTAYGGKARREVSPSGGEEDLMCPVVATLERAFLALAST